MTPQAPTGVRQLIERARGAVPSPSAAQAPLLHRLDALAERLAKDRLQLAVLGQFKRGKSSLINALLGEALLPTAAIPATANVTFIEWGVARELRVTFASGRIERLLAPDAKVLAQRLVELVTEASNPRNALGVKRAEVAVPARFLERGVVIVDTPGVGSTHVHNTDTARASLAECDMALLVLSAELPITEAEAKFIREVGEAATKIVVVMNKVDLVDADDLASVTGFLRSTLTKGSGLLASPEIIAVSAKEALRAKLRGDVGALEASGLPSLERHVKNALSRGRAALLSAAIARKASKVVSLLRFEADVLVTALQLPAEELARRSTAFEAAAVAFEEQRKTCRDLIAGDWHRSVTLLNAECDAIFLRARSSLRSSVEERVKAAPDFEAARRIVESAIGDFFDEANATVLRTMREDLAAKFLAHRSRTEDLQNNVQESAAQILHVVPAAGSLEEEPPSMREPYWVRSGRVETLGSLTVDGFAALLPRSVKEKRKRRLLLEGIAGAVTRNVSNLQWAMRQNLDDEFRRFGPRLDASIGATISALRDILQVSRDRRSSHEQDSQQELRRLIGCADELRSVEAALSRIVVGAGADAGTQSGPDRTQAQGATPPSSG